MKQSPQAAVRESALGSGLQGVTLTLDAVGRSQRFSTVGMHSIPPSEEGLQRRLSSVHQE